MCDLRWRSQNFHPATWKVVFFLFYSRLLRLPYSFLPFLLAIFTITKNRVFLSTLAITFTFSQCHFPFHSAFLANGKLVVKKVLFVNIFDNTRKRKNANESESMFYRKWWSTSKSQTDVCSAVCWNMNDNLVGQQTTGNVQLQLWHRWQRGLQLESDFFEKNTEY